MAGTTFSKIRLRKRRSIVQGQQTAQITSVRIKIPGFIKSRELYLRITLGWFCITTISYVRSYIVFLRIKLIGWMPLTFISQVQIFRDKPVIRFLIKYF